MEKRGDTEPQENETNIRIADFASHFWKDADFETDSSLGRYNICHVASLCATCVIQSPE
jgi:hypothetical protein